MVGEAELIPPARLFNLLNQVYLNKPSVADDCYMILFDSRKLHEYNNDHIVTSRHIHYNDEKGYVLPDIFNYSVFRHIVVIDSRTSSLRDIASPAITCAQLLWRAGSKYPIKIVEGGYEEFTAFYPFLRVQNVIFTKQEFYNIKIYPLEIERYLFIGNFHQASDKMISKHLKIKAHVNVSKNVDPRFENSCEIGGKNNTLVKQLLWIPINDDVNEDIYSYFATSSSFIDQHDVNDGKSILVYSGNGSSRSVAIILAYLISKKKLSLADAFRKVLVCHFNICPNRQFIESLLKWEAEVFGESKTKKKDLAFLSYE